MRSGTNSKHGDESLMGSFSCSLFIVVLDLPGIPGIEIKV